MKLKNTIDQELMLFNMIQIWKGSIRLEEIPLYEYGIPVQKRLVGELHLILLGDNSNWVTVRSI